MFGGNPGGKENRNGKLRLGDFWRLELTRQQSTDLERLILKEIRRTQFIEKSSDPIDALAFLQTEVSSCVNHQDPAEQREFHLLTSQLFNQVYFGDDRVKNFIIEIFRTKMSIITS